MNGLGAFSRIFGRGAIAADLLRIQGYWEPVHAGRPAVIDLLLRPAATAPDRKAHWLPAFQGAKTKKSAVIITLKSCKSATPPNTPMVFHPAAGRLHHAQIA